MNMQLENDWYQDKNHCLFAARKDAMMSWKIQPIEVEANTEEDVAEATSTAGELGWAGVLGDCKSREGKNS